MSFLSTVGWSVGGAIISGGAAGYLSSVFSARPVAQRQERERRRDEAEGRVHEAVGRYRGRLRAMNLAGVGIFPVDYADPAGREDLAEDILDQLPMLSPRKRERIRASLTALVGTKAVDLAAKRLAVPLADRPDADWDKERRDQIDRQIRIGYHGGTGCSQNVQRLCEQEHYPQVREDYGTLGLLRLASSMPHFDIRSPVLAETEALLATILDQVSANPQLPQRQVPPAVRAQETRATG